MSTREPVALLALVLLFNSPTLFAQKRPLGLDLTSTAERYAEAVGQKFSFVCPASDGGPAYVLGTLFKARISCELYLSSNNFGTGVSAVQVVNHQSDYQAISGTFTW